MATKKEKLTPKSLVGLNPAVDAEQLRNTLAELRKLREAGIEGPKYNLATPYGRRTVHGTHEAAWHR